MNSSELAIHELYGVTHPAITQLFPGMHEEGCVNFGLWPNKIPSVISMDERLIVQKGLYNHLFDIAQLSSHDNILEVGCGRGHGVYWASQKGLSVHGIDLLEAQISRCKTNYPHLTDRFQIGKADQIPFPDKSIDHVISVEAAQHFPDFRNFIQEAKRILKERGSVTLTTFFYTNQQGKEICKSCMPNEPMGVDRMIILEEATDAFKENNFYITSMHFIGNRTFEGFCRWAIQVDCCTPHTLKWFDLYQKGHIEYVTISATLIEPIVKIHSG